MARNKICHSITFLSTWKTSDWHFVPGDFYNIKEYIKEPFKNSFKNTLNQIMLDYFQKSIIPAFVKTMQIKHLSSTPMFNNLIKLMKNPFILMKKVNVKGFVLFQYRHYSDFSKQVSWKKFVKKRIFCKIFQSKNF